VEENPHGGEFLMGVRNGKEIYRSLDPQGARELKRNAEETLREGIPNQRKFLEVQEGCNAQASDIYPVLRDSNSLMSREIETYLQRIPFLKLIPDIKIWMGHAITQRDRYMAAKNGKTENQAQRRITQAVRTKVAPVIPRSRGVITTPRGADVDQALKTLKEKGDADAAEKWLEAKWAKPARSNIERVQ
jgi:hypothetical protein